jgi:hypothetical protein
VTFTQPLPGAIGNPFRQIPNGRLALIMLVFDIAKENFCAGNRSGRSNKTCTVTVLAVASSWLCPFWATLGWPFTRATRVQGFVEFDEAFRFQSIGQAAAHCWRSTPANAAWP